MNTYITLCFIVVAASVVQASVLSPRVKRQNFGWGDYDEDTLFNTQTPPRRTTPPPPPSSTPAAGTTTTTGSPEFTACVRRCASASITPQYNPICGSNRITYNNDSHLKCAQDCGLVVEKVRGGSCRP